MSISTPPTSTARLLATFILSAVAVLAVENAPCYFPGGEPALGFYPCQAFDAPISSCCPAGWTCFSNALCIATTVSNSFPNLTLGAVQRGACTNPEWNNNICGGACLDPDKYADGKLAACGDDRFCCETDFNSGKCGCDSQERDNALTITAGLAQTIIQVSDTTFVGAPSLSIASTRPTDIPTTTTEGAGSSSTTDASSSSSPTATGTGTTTSGDGTTTTPPSPTTSTGSSTSTPPGGDDTSGGDGGDNKNRTIGLAVGITVGVVAIAGVVLAYLFWWRPRQHRAADGDDDGVDGYQHDEAAAAMAPAEDHPNGPTFGHRYYGGQPAP
ncbi:hypothetical protein B0H66DRAFT_479806 [Apodospora peruviana]|uniref:Mid2 domain-containing protein n=1 Tax=Apodospora peruviana TaxID=516989 RepID=A0AAE0I104_9PEZI|nr:hypothetical protein B0H66DRAFT_479806 [Apodospora peruviana]